MANDSKNIKFRAVLDTSGFDQQIKQMQDRVTQIARQSGVMQTAQGQYGAGSGMSRLTQSFFGDFNRGSINELREQFNLNVRNMQHQSRDMQTKERELGKLAKLEKEMTEAQKERMKLLKDEISAIKEKGRTLIEENNRIANMAQRLGSGMEGFKGTGAVPGMAPGPHRAFDLEAMGNYRSYRGMGFGRGTSRIMAGIGGPGAFIGGIGAAVGIGAPIVHNMWEELALKQGNIAMAQGGAAANMSNVLKNLQTPQNILEQSAFMQERARALGISSQELGSQRGRDILGAAARPGGVIGGLLAAGGTVAGMKGGAALGMLGGPLAPVTVPLGAAVGGAAGYLGTNLLAGGLTDKNARGAILGTEEYRQQSIARALGRSSQIENALKELNIPKNLALKALQQRLPDILQAETAFGAQSPQAEGGFLRAMTQGGLTGTTGMNYAQQMMRMSGITTGMGDMGSVRNAFGLAQGGLSNAGQLMGAMRGLAAGVGEYAPENSMKKLFSEAVKFGIDDSKMVEEMRQFSGAAMNLAMEKGIRVEEAAGMISRSGMGQFSMPNLRASMNALQMRDQMAQDPGSMAFKMGFMSTQEGRGMFGGLGRMSRLRMAALKPTDITRDSESIKGMINEMGLEGTEEEKFQEFSRRYSQLELRGMIKHGPTLRKLQEYSEEQDPDRKKKMLGELMTSVQVLTGGKTSDRTIRSLIEGTSKPAETGLSPMADAMYQGYAGRGAGTVGARMEAGRAAAEEMAYSRLGGTDTESGKQYIDLFLDNMKNAASGSGELMGIISQMKTAASQSTEALSSFARVINAFATAQETGNMEGFYRAYERERSILEDMSGTTGQPNATGNTRGGQ